MEEGRGGPSDTLGEQNRVGAHRCRRGDTGGDLWLEAGKMRTHGAPMAKSPNWWRVNAPRGIEHAETQWFGEGARWCGRHGEVAAAACAACVFFVVELNGEEDGEGEWKGGLGWLGSTHLYAKGGGEADGGATAWVRTVAGWEWATVARGDAENNDMLSAWLVRYEADWAIQAMWRRDRARGEWIRTAWA